MKHSQLNLPVTPLQRVSEPFATEAKPSETGRKKVSWQQIPEDAMTRAGMRRQVVADAMGKSQSWLSRALRGFEKLGWIDLGGITDREFWAQMIDAICEFHCIEPRGLSAQDQEYMRIGKAFVDLQQQTMRSAQR